jgi:outer membrane protein X
MKCLSKRLAIIAIAVVTMCVSVTAQQKGDMAAGGFIAIGMGDELTNVGIGGKFQYNVIDPLRLEGSLTFFLPKDMGFSSKFSMWDISVNGHYLIPVADQITVYPLAGLGILGVKSSVDLGSLGGKQTHSDSDVCVNIGGGVDFKLTDQIYLNGEMKYKIVKNWNRFIISAGIAFKF